VSGLDRLDRLDITFCQGKEGLKPRKVVGCAVALKFINFLCLQAEITELLYWRLISKFFHNFELLVNRLYFGIVSFGIFHPVN